MCNGNVADLSSLGCGDPSKVLKSEEWHRFKFQKISWQQCENWMGRAELKRIHRLGNRRKNPDVQDAESGIVVEVEWKNRPWL